MQKVIEFQISELLGIGMTLVVLGIGVAYGLQVMGETEDDIGVITCARDGTTGASHIYYNATTKLCYNSSGTTQDPSTVQNAFEWNSSVSSIEGVSKIPEKLPTIATVIVASVIIGILVTYLWGRFAGG